MSWEALREWSPEEETRSEDPCLIRAGEDSAGVLAMGLEALPLTPAAAATVAAAMIKERPVRSRDEEEAVREGSGEQERWKEGQESLKEGQESVGGDVSPLGAPLPSSLSLPSHIAHALSHSHAPPVAAAAAAVPPAVAVAAARTASRCCLYSRTYRLRSAQNSFRRL